MIKTLIVLLSLGIITFYLITEHKAHLYGISQYLLFAVFILMHLFMHTGHGDHGSHKKGGHH